MKHLFSSLIFVILLAGAVVAQPEFFYYGLEGQIIEINPIDTLVAVRFAETATGSAQAFALRQTMLQDDDDYEFVGNRTFVFRLEPGYDLPSVMFALLADEEVAMTNPVGQDSFGNPWWMNNRLLVTYKQDADLAAIDSLESAFGLTRVETIDDSVRVVVLEYNEPTYFDITWLARNYYNTGFCIAVEPEITTQGYPATSDPFFIHQWQLENVGQEGGTIEADIDWEESRRFRSANFTKPIVAMIDAGFQLSHEDMASLANIWPYDAVGDDVFRPVPDADPGTSCDRPAEWCWHGTAVLGILKAHTDNALGIAGGEDSARVMPIKIVDALGYSSTATLARGLSWARANHGGASAQVICVTWVFANLSSPTVDNYLKILYNGGRPIVAATGNRGDVEYPANSPYVLAVGMSDRNDALVSGSGVGSEVDVIGPGKDVWSLDLMGEAGLSTSVNNCGGNVNYACNLTGTSFSAPLVAGIIARMLSANPFFMGPQQNPQSAEVIYDVIRRSADRAPYGVSGYQRVNDFVGWGRVNANKAVLAVKHGDANNDGQRNVTDVVYIINYIFDGGPNPVPEQLTGDTDCSGQVSISDAVYIINYVFASGPAPGVCAY